MNEIWNTPMQPWSYNNDVVEFANSMYTRQFVCSKFAQDKDVCERSWTISITPETEKAYAEVYKKLVAVIETLSKAEKINRLFEPDHRGTVPKTQYFAKDFHLECLYRPKSYLGWDFVYDSKCSIFNEVFEIMEKLSIGEEADVNEFCVLSQTMRGLEVRTIPDGTHALEHGNYSPEVRAGYKNIVEELNLVRPRGRLSILEGPPGTGKTFLIRNLPLVVPDSTFIIVPPALVAQLGDPQLVGSLLNIKEDLRADNKTITLVLEDADDCLKKRDGTNASLVSALLNSSSGILGEALNLRLLATSNLPKAEIDPAALRPGRLGTYIRVGELDHQTAGDVYRRLVGDPKGIYDTTKGRTLAEVYGAAHGQSKSDIRFGEEDSKEDMADMVL